MFISVLGKKNVNLGHAAPGKVIQSVRAGLKEAVPLFEDDGIGRKPLCRHAYGGNRRSIEKSLDYLNMLAQY